MDLFYLSKPKSRDVWKFSKIKPEYTNNTVIYFTQKLFRQAECDDIGKAVKKFWLKKDLLDWKSIKLFLTLLWPL